MAGMIAGAWQWLRSLVFVVQMYLAMVLLALVFIPWAAVDRRGARIGVRTFCRWVRYTAHHLCGLRSEIRGEIPRDEVMVASKHQSFFDIILLCSVLPRPRFVMKRELTRAPILGWFAKRIGCIPVDRGRRSEAIAAMMAAVEEGRSAPGQMVIYPQGTRAAPGAQLPYKVGSSVLYEQLGQPCVPAATNVGVFWPRLGVRREPGLAVLEFLDTIPSGLSASVFLAEIERRVEAASDRLMEEAGFTRQA